MNKKTLRRILRYVRPYMKRVAGGMTCKFLGTIMDLFLPWLLAHVLDHVVPLKDAMLAGGATRAMMSGSGPSVFGIFARVEDATAVCERLRASGADAFVCHPCGKYCDL